MIKSSNHTPLPKAGEGKRGDNGYLGYLLRQAANTYRYRVESALSDLPLTQPQFSALVMLEAYPDHSSADLARMAFLTPQTMSVIVSNLSKSGLITRSPHAVHWQEAAYRAHGAGPKNASRCKGARNMPLKRICLQAFQMTKQQQSGTGWLVFYERNL